MDYPIHLFVQEEHESARQRSCMGRATPLIVDDGEWSRPCVLEDRTDEVPAFPEDPGRTHDEISRAEVVLSGQLRTPVGVNGAGWVLLRILVFLISGED